MSDNTYLDYICALDVTATLVQVHMYIAPPMCMYMCQLSQSNESTDHTEFKMTSLLHEYTPGQSHGVQHSNRT